MDWSRAVRIGLGPDDPPAEEGLKRRIGAPIAAVLTVMNSACGASSRALSSFIVFAGRFHKKLLLFFPLPCRFSLDTDES